MIDVFEFLAGALTGLALFYAYEWVAHKVRAARSRKMHTEDLEEG